MPVTGEVTQELVVDAWLFEQLGEQFVRLGLRLENGEHPGVLIAEQELDRAVLVRLEPGGVAEEPAELCILGGREGREHRPLLGELALDVLDARDALERGLQLVVRNERPRGEQLVPHELEPELARLMLDDEEHLVVMLRRADGHLGREHPVELQVRAVAHPVLEVGDDLGFDGAFVRRCVGHCNTLLRNRDDRHEIVTTDLVPP